MLPRTRSGVSHFGPLVRSQAVTFSYIAFVKTIDELQEAWNEACRVERATWQRVHDRLPGTAAFDARLWEDWRAAVDALEVARKELAHAIDQWQEKS